MARLLFEARRAARITQATLAERGATSQSSIADYESGRVEPRLSTLARLLEATGHELVLECRPEGDGRTSATEVADCMARSLREADEAEAWRWLLQLVDDFRGAPDARRAGLVAEAPPSCGDRRHDAALAALVEHLCAQSALPTPAWTGEDWRFAEPWWFVAGLPALEAPALRDAPSASSATASSSATGPSTVPELLGRQDILDAFDKLSSECARRRIRADVFVVGGAAMALAYVSQRRTRDVDAVFAPAAEVYEAARAVARPSTSRATGSTTLKTSRFSIRCAGCRPAGRASSC